MKLPPLAAVAFLYCGLLVFISSAPSLAEDVIPQDDPYAARKLFYEKHWKEKLEDALTYVDGVVVTVDVELTTEMEKTVTSTKCDGEPVTQSEKNKTRVIKENDGGTAEFKSQKPSSESEKESHEEESSANYMIPTCETTISTAGLVPKKVSVCVSIPRSYYDAVQSHRLGKSSKDAEHRIEEAVTLSVTESVAILLPNEPSQRASVRVVSFDNVSGSKASETESFSERWERVVRKGDVFTVSFAGQRFALVDGVLSTPRSSRQQSIQIPVVVVSISSSGRLVLEGKQRILNNGVEGTIHVSGNIRSSSIAPDRIVAANHIHDLQVDFQELAE